VLRFRDEVSVQHATNRIHLLFNNAGIGGGGSIIVNERAEWERTFNICWGGVYLSTRAFLPMLRAADEAHIINTSSMNGFWASVGPYTPHTAYSAAKFAVKGFTEALIADFRMNAPHIIEHMHAERARRFVTDAPTSAAEAAKIILDGVRADRLRILVGPDAHIIDRMVREDPDHAYEPEFYERFATEAGWSLGR